MSAHEGSAWQASQDAIGDRIAAKVKAAEAEIAAQLAGYQVPPIQDLPTANVADERWHAAHAGHAEYDKEAETCRCGGAGTTGPAPSESRRQVGGRSATFATAQRQAHENPAAGPANPLPDTLLEDLSNGRPFSVPGPSEFEMRDALDTRLAGVATALASLRTSVERLTDLAHKKLTAKPPRRRKTAARAPKRKGKRTK